jgi:mono/diheme cytochrome c family protein
MNTRIFTLCVAVLSAPTFAADNGKNLHDQHCKSCHVQQWGGDGSSVYTRPAHRIKDLTALKQRVATCSSMTGAKIFPEEEASIAAYLAQQYYHFK